jgi:hypothetical protein
MPLQAKQRQLVQLWFQQKCKEHTCPACGGRSWSIVEVAGLSLVSAPNMAKDTEETGTAYASVLRMCDNCAYIAHFLLPSIMERRR